MSRHWLAIGITALFPACELIEDKSPEYELEGDGAVIQVRKDCDCVRIVNQERSHLFFDVTPVDSTPDLELEISGDTLKNRNYIDGDRARALYFSQFEGVRKEDGFVDVHLWRFHPDSGRNRFGEPRRYRIETFP